MSVPLPATFARVIAALAASLCFAAGAGAERILRQSGIIDAPPEEIFAAFQTPEGIVRAWGVAKAKVDFRVGGEIRTCYQPDGDLDAPTAIVNTILAYEPDRMLAIKAAAPEGAPDWLRAICESGWSVLRFEPVAPGKTRFTCTGMGYKDGPLFDKAYEFFEKGNESTIRHIQQAFSDGEATAILASGTMDAVRALAGDWTSETQRPDGSVFRARTRWAPIHGGFIRAEGWLGDQDGMHPHGLFVCGKDPLTGEVAFWNFGERGDIARGNLTPMDRTRFVMDWNAATPEGEATRHIEMHLDGRDVYTLRMYTDAEEAASGAKPLIEVRYERVQGDVPERFLREAGAR